MPRALPLNNINKYALPQLSHFVTGTRQLGSKQDNYTRRRTNYGVYGTRVSSRVLGVRLNTRRHPSKHTEQSQLAVSEQSESDRQSTHHDNVNSIRYVSRPDISPPRLHITLPADPAYHRQASQADSAPYSYRIQRLQRSQIPRSVPSAHLEWRIGKRKRFRWLVSGTR